MCRVPPWKKKRRRRRNGLEIETKGGREELPCRPAWGVLGIFPANDEKRREICLGSTPPPFPAFLEADE